MTRYLKGGRKMVSFRLPPKMEDALTKLAKRLRLNRSEMLADAARRLLADHGQHFDEDGEPTTGEPPAKPRRPKGAT